MNRIVVFTLALLLMLPALAFAEDLSVMIAAPLDGIYPGEIANCPAAVQSGNPTRIDSQFTISNPWPISMSVWYDYYDFGTDAWVEGSHPICNVPPSMTEPICRVTTPLSLGGRGSGTLTSVPYLRLKGTDPDGKHQVLTKTLSYTFAHFESETETNAKVKITALGDLITSMGTGSGTCYKDFCCGAGGSALEAAKTAKSAAEASLKACNLPAAYNGAANAINTLNAASTASDPACVSAVAAATSASEKIDAVEKKIVASAACETRTASQMLDLAKLKLMVSSYLEDGNFEKASQDSAAAAVTASEAEAAINCTTAPAGSGTPTFPPSTPPASTPPASQPSSTTPPASQPAPSGGSGCPLGLAVLLGGLLAAWRHRVR